MPPSPFIVNQAMAGMFFGVSERAIGKWLKAGCPRIAKGKYDLKDMFNWWQDNMMATKVEEADATLAIAKLEYWQGKAVNETLKANKERSRLISKEAVAAGWSARLSEVANGLQSFSMRLPPLLEGKNQSEMRRIIDDEQWKLRDNFYRNGRFCMPDEDKPENEEEDK